MSRDVIRSGADPSRAHRDLEMNVKRNQYGVGASLPGAGNFTRQERRHYAQTTSRVKKRRYAFRSYYFTFMRFSRLNDKRYTIVFTITR